MKWTTRILFCGVLVSQMGHGGGCGGESSIFGPPTESVCPPTSTLTYNNFGKGFMESFCVKCHDSNKSRSAPGRALVPCSTLVESIPVDTSTRLRHRARGARTKACRTPIPSYAQQRHSSRMTPWGFPLSTRHGDLTAGGGGGGGRAPGARAATPPPIAPSSSSSSSSDPPALCGFERGLDGARACVSMVVICVSAHARVGPHALPAPCSSPLRSREVLASTSGSVDDLRRV